VAQKELGVSHGSIKATVLIETIVAAFEMDEILWELREHSRASTSAAGLHILLHQEVPLAPEFLPGRPREVTMTSPSCAPTRAAVKDLHRRNAPAMGGMAAQIPIKNDPRPTRRRWRRCAPTSCAR